MFQKKIKLKYMYQLADILNYLHGNGIIHRDLKPANIIINEKKEKLFLLDFGLAKSIFGKIGIGDRSAPSNKITLCNEYRFYREGNQDHTKTSFDIFSFGVIMYFIFSDGKNMFSSAETLKKLILKREDFNKYLNNNDKFAGIKDSIKDIIIKCVSYDEKNQILCRMS